MKIDILGSYGGNADYYKLTSFLIDDFLALDAGCLTSALNLERQYKITDVFVSHSHIDHTGSLPYLIDNQFGLTDRPLRIWSSPFVIDALKKHIFNDVVWPDFSRLPDGQTPSLCFESLEPERDVTVGHLRITPVAVNHLVPCQAFFVESLRSHTCLLYTADTTNTDRVWELANQRDNLRCVIVDCSFPDHLEELAVASGHMTPKLMARDLAKLDKSCQILVYHLKPSFDGRMNKELAELGLDLDYDIQGKTFYLT